MLHIQAHSIALCLLPLQEGYSALYIAQTVHNNTTIVDILSRVTQITQTIRIKRRPGEEGDDEEPEIIFSQIPEELELEEVLEDIEKHEAEEGMHLLQFIVHARMQ